MKLTIINTFVVVGLTASVAQAMNPNRIDRLPYKDFDHLNETRSYPAAQKEREELFKGKKTRTFYVANSSHVTGVKKDKNSIDKNLLYEKVGGVPYLVNSMAYFKAYDAQIVEENPILADLVKITNDAADAHDRKLTDPLFVEKALTAMQMNPDPKSILKEKSKSFDAQKDDAAKSNKKSNADLLFFVEAIASLSRDAQKNEHVDDACVIIEEENPKSIGYNLSLN